MKLDRICCGLLKRGGASETLPGGPCPCVGGTLGNLKDPPCTDELGAPLPDELGPGKTPPASAGPGADNGGRNAESWFTVLGGSVSTGN